MNFFHYLLPDISHLGIAGYWVILLISFLEAFVITGWVVPGTVLVVIAGGLSAHGVYDFWDLVFFATVGAVIGDGISYEMGHKGTGYFQQKAFIKRQIERGKKFFLRHQGKSIVLGRFIGWIRPIVPFIAGVMGMTRGKFYTLNILSGIAWAISYLAAGYIFGTAWKLALLWITRGGLFFFGIFLLFLLLGWIWRLVLHHGKPVWKVIASVGTSVFQGFISNTYVQRWSKQHTSLIRSVQRRFSLHTFWGLPLTFFVLACLASTYALIGITEDYISHDPLIQADIRLEHLLVAFRSPALLTVFYTITLSAQAIVLLPAAIILSAVLWLRKKRIYIVTLWMTLLGSEAITTAGKFLFHRPRPDGIIPTIVEDSFSYPSGHATAVVAFYGFLAYLYVRHNRLWKVKIGALFVALIMVLVIDISRMYLGIHYLSDVLAGNMVGLTMLLLATSITEWIQWNRSQKITISLWPLGAALVAIPLCITTVLFTMPTPWKGKTVPQDTVHSITKNELLPLFTQNTLPKYSETLLGNAQEPLNIILIGSTSCITTTLQHANWDIADPVSFTSTYKAGKAAILNAPYPQAPITPLFYNGYPHDLGFEKSTEKDSVRSRHHARFWRTNYVIGKDAIFVGTASLDTGIKWGITHTISPAIDAERDTFVSNLQSTGDVSSVRTIPFVAPELGTNFAGDQFFTDGALALVQLRGCAE